ncbi:MAG TPA: isochorismatase family protein [Chloroflexota bacterium]|nr:isochorismatase family protein [Chloroflexota bacterium]
MDQSLLQLHFRSQQLATDANGYRIWQAAESRKEVPSAQTAIIICDMWDRHWSRGAAERVAAMAPRLDRVVRAAREHGVQIIHAPSETMDFYAHTPSRQRVAEISRVAMPEPIDHLDPELPVDASDGGSDTGETSSYKAWTRQHPAIWIDPERDGVSDDGEEIYSFLRQRGIEQVCLMGVHTNMCILRRPFGIKALVRLGIPVALVRDLTDAMYNPERSPYVSHGEGTRLVIDYIEKFWCPTVESRDFLANAF